MYLSMMDCSFYSLVYFLYILLSRKFKYFSSGRCSSFSVKFRYQLYVSVVSFENIWVIPEKRLEPLLCAVEPELIFLAATYFGIFFLYCYSIVFRD